MTEISTEMLSLLLEEGTDVIASFMGESVNENTLAYQSLHYVLTKGIEFILPTVLSASFGDPTAFTLGLIRRDLSRIQKDLDYFREIPFHQIKYLIEEVEVDCEDEANHFDAYEKFKLIERKSIEAIFSSKKFENKIKAAQIAILAKSYIKRFDLDSGVFLDLNIIDKAKKKSLANQMQRLLSEFVQMAEYKAALEKSKEAWYRLDSTRRENHAIVDQVDELKRSVFANSVLCLNTVRPARTPLVHGVPVLVKTIVLSTDWIPEGERHALELTLTEDDLALLFSVVDDDIEEYEEFGENEEGEEEEEENEEEEERTEGDDETDDDFSSGSEEGYDLKNLFMDSEDENLSEDEDEESTDFETEAEPEEEIACQKSSVFETTSIETLGVRNDPIRIYTNLNGEVFIKAGLKCKLFVNRSVQEESEVVQNAWLIEDPPERLKLEFLVHKERLISRRNISLKKLNLTEEMGLELIDVLSGSSSGSVSRARRSLFSGTVSLVQWNIPWLEVEEALDTERDIQSPLFQPLPIDANQPYLKAIVDGRMKKIGIKKFGWTKTDNTLVAGMMVWDPDKDIVNQIGPLRTLQGNVKDLQMKNIVWEDLQDCSNCRVDIFLFSYVNCHQEG